MAGLQYNDFLVIQIDTDVQDAPGFDVPKRDGARELSITERAERVIERIKADVDTPYFSAHSDRFVFAVAVDSVECWLLPLLYTDKKAGKTTGCLETANRELRRKNEDGLSAGEKKFVAAYEKASRGFRKRRTLLQSRDKNPSLGLFVNQLDNLQGATGQPMPGPPGDSSSSSADPAP